MNKRITIFLTIFCLICLAGNFSAQDTPVGKKLKTGLWPIVPGIIHFEMYIGEAFEISSNSAAAWFREHLGLEPKAEAKPTGQ